MEISEAIDLTLARCERHETDATAFFSDLAATHPDMFTFLFDEDTKLLLEQEHDYMLFIAMILVEAMLLIQTDLTSPGMECYEEAAERNWGLLEFTSIENISSTLTGSPGSSLYTFLEEACTPVKEHDVLTETAAELVYVKCKSLIDCAYPLT